MVVSYVKYKIIMRRVNNLKLKMIVVYCLFAVSFSLPYPQPEDENNPEDVDKLEVTEDAGKAEGKDDTKDADKPEGKDDAEDAGKPEGNDNAEDADKPELKDDTDNTDKPEGKEDTGKEVDQAKPEVAGKSDDEKKIEDASKPKDEDNAGDIDQQVNAEKPDKADDTGDAEKSDIAGKSEKMENNGEAENANTKDAGSPENPTKTNTTDNIGDEDQTSNSTLNSSQSYNVTLVPANRIRNVVNVTIGDKIVQIFYEERVPLVTKPGCSCVTRAPLSRMKLFGNIHFKRIKVTPPKYVTLPTKSSSSTPCPPCPPCPSCDRLNEIDSLV